MRRLVARWQRSDESGGELCAAPWPGAVDVRVLAAEADGGRRQGSVERPCLAGARAGRCRRDGRCDSGAGHSGDAPAPAAPHRRSAGAQSSPSSHGCHAATAVLTLAVTAAATKLTGRQQISVPRLVTAAATGATISRADRKFKPPIVSTCRGRERPIRHFMSTHRRATAAGAV